MRFCILALMFICLPFSIAHANDADNGKEGFTTMCKVQVKQSNDFCSCAMNFYFPEAVKKANAVEQAKLHFPRKSMLKVHDDLIEMDPALNTEKMDQLCDIYDKYKNEHDEYILHNGDERYNNLKVFQKKNIDRRQKYIKQTKALALQFGLNKDSREVFERLASGYCTARTHYRKALKEFEDVSKTETQVDIWKVLQDARSRGSQCHKLYKHTDQ